MVLRVAVAVAIVLCTTLSVHGQNARGIVDSTNPDRLTEISPGKFVQWLPKWCRVVTDRNKPLGTNALTGDVVYATSCAGFCFNRVSPILDWLTPRIQQGQYECGVKLSHSVKINSLYIGLPEIDPVSGRKSFLYQRKVTVIDQCGCIPKPCVETDPDTQVQTTHASGSTYYNSCNEKCTCTAGVSTCCRRRKSFVHMSFTERLRYTSAVRDVATGAAGVALQTEYVNLIKDHEASFNGGIHASDELLPWHRVFILKLENILRKVDCRITVPYWAWELDAADLWGSSVWSAGPDGFGGGVNSVVTDGAFANPPFQLTPYAAQNNAVYGDYLLRRGRTGAAPGSIFSVGTMLATPATQFNTFHSLINSMHGSMHCAIDYTMCLRSSAEDPIFFLHHGNMDRLWAKWQAMSPAHATAFAAGGINTPMTASSTTVQKSGGGTWQPADVMNIRDHLDTCVEYVEPGGFILVEDIVARFPVDFLSKLARIKPTQKAVAQLAQWVKLHNSSDMMSGEVGPDFVEAWKDLPELQYQDNPNDYRDPFTALFGVNPTDLFTMINEGIDQEAKGGETIFTQQIRSLLDRLNEDVIDVEPPRYTDATGLAQGGSPCKGN